MDVAGRLVRVVGQGQALHDARTAQVQKEGVVLFDQRGQGMFETRQPYGVRFRGEDVVVPAGFAFDTLFGAPIVDRILPLSMLDLKVLATVDFVEQSAPRERRTDAADVALAAFKANGSPLLKRWSVWVALSWRAHLAELSALRRGDRTALRRLVGRRILKTAFVSLLLLVPVALPFTAGVVVPVPALDTAVGAGLVATIETTGIAVGRRMRRPRGQSPFVWLDEFGP